MKQSKILDLVDVEKIFNPHLKELVFHLKKSLASGHKTLSIVPETAQLSSKWHHHTDHQDYAAHTDTGGPQHGDYCD